MGHIVGLPLSSSTHAIRRLLGDRVVLVQAPAGWGKTTAVHRALEETPHTWVDVRSIIHETPTLLFGLAKSFRLLSSAVTSLVRSTDENAVVDMIQWLGSSLPSGTIVLDDMHFLDQVSFEILSGVITERPDIHWILISRHKLDLPFASWVAKGFASLSIGSSELALSEIEIEKLLRGSGLRSDPTIVRELLETTKGWPVAIRFAVLALGRSSDTKNALNFIRSATAEFLQEQAFKNFTDEQISLLRDVGYIPWFDKEYLKALGRKTSDLRWLLDSGIPLHEHGSGWSIHALVSEWLYQRDDRSEETRSKHIYETLIACKRHDDAFDFARKFLPNVLEKLISEEGFNLLERGRWRSLEIAINSLGTEIRTSSPMILALRGTLYAESGDWKQAEQCYEKALLKNKSKDLQALITSKYALHLVNRGDPRAYTILNPVLSYGNEWMQAEIASIAGLSLANTGDFSDALAHVESARSKALTLDDDKLLGRIMMRSAYVAFYADDHTHAEQWSNEATRISERTGDWGIFAYAHGVLYSLFEHFHEDKPMALWHAQQVVVGGERAADRRLYSFGIAAQYEIEVERARYTHADEIEKRMGTALSGLRETFGWRLTSAIRMAQSGRFSDAVRILLLLQDGLANPLEKRCWAASVAMFSAFSGDSEKAEKYLTLCGRSSGEESVAAEVQDALAECFAAFTEISLGRVSAAARRSLPRSKRKQISALVKTIQSLCEPSALLSPHSIFDVLSEEGQPGYADFLRKAFEPKASMSVVLTDSELRVLQSMALGKKAKVIASDAQKSIETVRSQMKSLARKLDTSSSGETVAAARRLNII